MERKLADMQNHYILCGYGRVGTAVYEELMKRNQKVIIIEKNEEKIEQKTYLYDDCGMGAWIEKISATEKGEDDNTIMEKNYYFLKESTFKKNYIKK